MQEASRQHEKEALTREWQEETRIRTFIQNKEVKA